MARGYANIATSIWRDDDFRRLSPAAKLTYLMLVSQANLSACGLLDLTEARWAASMGITKQQLGATLEQLHEHRYIVLDLEAEQLLIRTFVKWDGGVNNEKRRKAITGATAAVTSPAIADSLRETLAGFGIPDRLAMPHAMPYPMGDDLALSPVDNPPGDAPSDSPSDTPWHSRRVVVKERNQNPNPQPATREPDPQPGTGGREPSPLSGRPHPWCSKHPGGTDDPCAPCGRARQTTEAWDRDAPKRRRAEAEARAAATAACTRCDPDGWELDLTGNPTANRCPHPTENTP